MKKWELVFIPSPGIGHLVSTVEVAKILVNQNEHLSITLLLMKLPLLDTKTSNSYIESLSKSPIPRMKLVELIKNKSTHSWREDSRLLPCSIGLIPTKVLPGILFDKDGGGCDAFLDQVRRYRETKGIIINTFLELETHAIEALSKDSRIPPIYTAGPLLNLEPTSDENQDSEHQTLLKWLDLQPQSSVVFLCFGSFGSFSVQQVKEIANALERSGHRFLWSLRKPPAKGKVEAPREYKNLEEVLPEGFLNWTSEIGKIIGWAPQIAVLSHPAVGGFVSHCGWNSTLESVWFGVPMATWPLYSEQQANAFEMVKDLEMAVEVKMDYRRDLGSESPEILGADLIEERIRYLMDPQNVIIRNKVKEMKEKSRLALKEGGSSYSSMECFVHSVLGNSS